MACCNLLHTSPYHTENTLYSPYLLTLDGSEHSHTTYTQCFYLHTMNGHRLNLFSTEKMSVVLFYLTAVPLYKLVDVI